MTKKQYLTGVLRSAGITGTIYDSLKRMTEDEGTCYAGILRCSDKTARAKSKTTYGQGAVTMGRFKLYSVETKYRVVITEYDEEHLETYVEEFVKNLSKGYDDGDGNWVGVECGEVDWVDEQDSILKAKLSVEIPVTFTYGLYRDVPVGQMNGQPAVGLEKEG